MCFSHAWPFRTEERGGEDASAQTGHIMRHHTASAICSPPPARPVAGAASPCLVALGADGAWSGAVGGVGAVRPSVAVGCADTAEPTAGEHAGDEDDAAVSAAGG